MGERSLPGRIVQLLLFWLGGACCGFGVGLLLSRSRLTGLDLGREGLLRAADAAVYDIFVPLLSGTPSFVLALLILFLGAVLAGVAFLLALRAAKAKGRLVLAVILGLVIGGGVAAITLLFADGPTRTAEAMANAEIGMGAILRATMWPRLIYTMIFGAAVGWAVAAAAATTWVRRILLVLVVLVHVVGATIVVRMARPSPIDVPANAPQLEAGAESQEVPLWIVGQSKQAERVELDLSVFFHGREAKSNLLQINRRNSTRAMKAIQDYPLLHPRSSAAEQLLAASAMSDLDLDGTVEALLKSFHRRGNPADGRLLISLLGGAAPSPRVVKLLEMITAPGQAKVGPEAAEQLCILAKAAGQAEPAQRLGCIGSIGKAPLSQVKVQLSFKGRPLRRVPVGLIRAPDPKNAGWIKQGKIRASDLQLLTGDRTDVRGGITLNNIPPGSYLLAVSPSQHQAKGGAVSIDREIRIEVPAEAGVVDLGEIQAGGPGVGGGSRSRPAFNTIKTAPPSSSNVTPTDDSEQQDGEPPEEGQDEPVGEPQEGPSKVSPSSPDAERPLPRAAKRIVASIRPAGSLRVSVPADFGDQLLDGDQSIISPQATIEPETTGGGQVKGLRIRGIRSNGVEVALGFMDGDVIESVNGRPLRDPDDLVELVDQLSGARRIMVRIRREGRPMILRIDVDRE
jgi:hypothetical protein